MSDNIVVGIDVGTTKVCTLVGEVRADAIHIIGVGIEPSRGMKKGVVNDVNTLTQAVSASIHKAERSSGYRIGSAFVSVAGAHIDSPQQSRCGGHQRDAGRSACRSGTGDGIRPRHRPPP